MTFRKYQRIERTLKIIGFVKQPTNIVIVVLESGGPNSWKVGAVSILNVWKLGNNAMQKPGNTLEFY